MNLLQREQKTENSSQKSKKMAEIKISEKNIQNAYKVADENVKKVLDALFGTENESIDYSDFYNIKTYEDACKALGYEVFNDWGILEPDEIAYMKLKTISKALWGKGFIPYPDPSGDKNYWFPWFALYTQDEIDDMDDDKAGSLLSGYASYGAIAGFGVLRTVSRSSASLAYVGFRLCQETEAKAEYFGKQFIELWADYLLIDFKKN